MIIRRVSLLLSAVLVGAASPALVQAPAVHADAAFRPVAATVSSSSTHTLVIGPDRRVYGTGNDQDSGSMPRGGDVASLHTLTRLDALPGGDAPVAVASGYRHSLVLGESGTVYGAGYDHNGELGDGAALAPAGVWVPIALPPGVTATSVTAMAQGTVILGSDGLVYGSGVNQPASTSYGVLTGTAASYASTTQLTGLPGGVTAELVAAGGDQWRSRHHLVVLGSNGVVYGTGANDSGQLTGLPAGGVTTLTPLTTVPSGTVTAIAANGRSTYVVVDGRAYVTGQVKNFSAVTPGVGDMTSSFQLVGAADPAVGAVNTDVVSVVAGRNHVMLVRADGSVYATGFNGSAQFGMPSSILEGGVYETDQLVRIAADAGPVAEVASGDQSVVIRSRTGLLWGAGDNYVAQLTGSVGTTTDTFTPLSGQVNAPTKAPVLGGTARVGRTLSVTAGEWFVRPQSLGHQWLRDGSAIPGATASTYRLTAADAGRRVSVRVTAQHTGVTSASTTTAVKAVALHATSAPKVKGKARVGKRLRVASVGAWSGSPTSYSYQWLRNGKPIKKKGTAKRYRLVKKDKGKRVSVRVTASRAGFGDGVATSRAVKVKKRR